MPSCVAYGCSNRLTGKSKKQKLEEETKKVTFHRFPKCVKRQKMWIQAINRDKWMPSPRSVICSDHFEEKYFDRTSLVYVRLRENAVPTIFKSFPSCLQKKCLTRKQPRERMSPTIQKTPDSDEANVSAKEANFQMEDAVLMNSSGKISRGTEISPQRFSSPVNVLLRKEMQQQNFKYRQRIRVLQDAKRRHVKKIASLQSVIFTLRNENLLLEENLNILSSLSGSNKEVQPYEF